jgi:hypothetical protein
MMCAMSVPKDSERRRSTAPNAAAGASSEGQGVLSNLPRTRPQRSSPRRAAARAAEAAARAGAPGAGAAQSAPARSNGHAGAPARKATPRAPKRSSSSAAKPAATVEPAPRQGFECEGERLGGSVHPPGGAELVASAVEIVGELAKAGLSSGERLFKDVLSRLPLA